MAPPLKRDSCEEELRLRNECKRGLGLGPRGRYLFVFFFLFSMRRIGSIVHSQIHVPDCYADTQKEFCAKEEYKLRLCLSLLSCYKYAKVLYDSDQPRKRRVNANKGLQKCLRQNHLKELECKRGLA